MESKKEHIKNAGLKVTTARVVILGIFEQKPNAHFSAEDLYHVLVAEGYDFSLATVYRVLTQFEKAGMLMKHRFEEEKSVYELASDEHHDHLVCVKCGKIEEFNDSIIEQRQVEVAKKFNFKMTEHSLSMYGLCNVCQ
ncbi:MAG: ferric iron uptake transcriptional regulator [Francisellaceae bacterium]|nr:ferric iron uptake transcriptional regulator [Francisellaceae bacterium]MBT6208071.1 ferric iron uptake transcriptional regulator [Francisellaceae bacterium]MBT6538791.1 ferric iron uptake transcriptional regulator [Francisellaceae bacterium]